MLLNNTGILPYRFTIPSVYSMHESVSLPHSLQTVSLCQVPEGERVFHTVESSQSTSKPTTLSNHQQMQTPVLGHPNYEPAESLRRRVRELETKLSQYQV